MDKTLITKPVMTYHHDYNSILTAKRGSLLPLFCLFFLISFSVISQEISKELDSIKAIKGTHLEKLDLYQNHLTRLQINKEFAQQGTDAHELAKWLYKEKRLEEAIAITQIAVDARKKATPKDLELLKKSYFNLGLFNEKLQRYTLSIEAYNELISTNNSNTLKGNTFYHLGKNYLQLNDPFKAVENFLLTFSYYHPEKDRSRIIRNHVHAAIAYKNFRNSWGSKNALKHLFKADSLAKIYSKTTDRYRYIIGSNIGGIHLEKTIPDVEKAKVYYLKALDLAKKIGREDHLGSVHYNLGLVYTTINSKTAKEYFKKSFQYPKGNEHLPPSIYLGLGTLEYNDNNYYNATSYYLKALSFFYNKKITESNYSPSYGELKNVQDKSLLIELLKRQIKNQIASANDQLDKQGYLKAINIAKTSDRLTDIMINEQLSERFDLLRKSIVSGNYILGVEACFNANKIEDAYYFMEKNKAILLSKEIRKKRVLLPELILEQEAKLKNNIIELQNAFQNTISKDKESIQRNITEEKIRLQQFQDSLSYKYPEYFSNTKLPEIVSFQNVKPRNNEIIIHYNMTETVSGVIPKAYNMVITNGKTKLYKITTVDRLLANIKKLRTQLDQPFTTQQDILNYRQTANEIYNTLIPKEIQPELKDKKVTVIGDHMINFIPFEALVTDVKTGKYLIEDCEIHYEYSLSFQKENASIARNASKDFFGLAPVDFSANLAKLQHSQKEIAAIHQYYDGEILANDQATKDNFIKHANDYKILHLATHADASDSIAPWIAFRNSKIEQSALTTIQNQAELVVLSACNTSIGEVRRGEGVLSLARSFFQGGANTVIPSLWSTNDKATAMITSDFYKHLSQGQTKSEALRTAKLNYLQNNTDAEASPHYWASLVLIGDAGTLLPQTDYWSYAIWIGLVLPIIILLWFLIFKPKKKTTSQ